MKRELEGLNIQSKIIAPHFYSNQLLIDKKFLFLHIIGYNNDEIVLAVLKSTVVIKTEEDFEVSRT